MVTMFVRHQVNDFETWKRVYDDFAADQERLGVLDEAVYQAADNPNDVTVTHDFESLADAHAFMASEELHNAMDESGVAGQPTIWFTQQV